MLEVEFDERRLEVIARGLSPVWIGRRATLAMNRSLELLRNLVREATPIWRGTARASVTVEARGTPVQIGIIASSLIYFPVLDLGRKPGHPPPFEALIPWVRDHFSGQEGRIRSIAFLVARAIGRRGTPAHHMLEQAAQKGTLAVEAIWMRIFKDFGTDV